MRTLESQAWVELLELGIDSELPMPDGRAAADPQLWRPGSPRLYDIAVTFGVDSIRKRVGFRTIERLVTQTLLNGEPLWLRGVCCPADDVELGKATTDDDLRRRLTLVRDLGANAVRLTPYPHHERVAELADEAGIPLIEEIPVY